MIFRGNCRRCEREVVFEIPGFKPEEFGMTSEQVKKSWAVCDECRAKEEAAKAARIAEEQKATLDAEKQKRRKESRIPAIYGDAWDISKGNNALLRFVRENQQVSLFIASAASGRCKTRAVCAVALELAEAGRSVEFWKTTQLTRRLAALYGESVTEADAVINLLCGLDLLILDDLCKEKLTDRAGELLFDIIDV